MEATDKQFILTFIAVTALLVVIAVIVLIIANAVGSKADEGRISQAQINIVNERIKPIGQVSLKSQPVSMVIQDPTTIVAVADNSSDVAATEQDSGGKIYSGICQSCHAIGVAGAPLVGNIQEWKRRLDVGGIEKLYQSALQGIGAMPGKGGNPGLTDAEVKSAVDYMVRSSR